MDEIPPRRLLPTRPGKRPIIDNLGSAARDHLANERTFLAWIRTALALSGLGVVIGRFVETQGPLAEVLGLFLVAMGGVMVVYAIGRFEKISGMIERGKYQVATWGPLLIAIMMVAAVVAGGTAIVLAGL